VRADEPTSSTRCPRCFYDLRGIVATWDDSCAVGGRCAECGLEFEWGELLNPARCPPRWCVEYAQSLARVVITFIQTLAMSFAPARFWHDLRMTHAPRWRRIIAVPITLAILLYLIFSSQQAWLAWEDYQVVEVHAAQYNAAYGQQANFKPIVMPPVWRVVCNAFLMPLSQNVEQPTNIPARPWTWRGGEGLAPPGALRARQWGWRYMSWHGVRVALQAIAFPLLGSLLTATCFVLLPISRKRARVRPRHLLRISVYSSWFCLIPVGYLLFAEIPRSIHLDRHNTIFGTMCFIALPIWMAVWWGFAIRNHLKMSHAWPVAIALTAIAGMILLLSGYYRFMIWHWDRLFL